VTKRAPNVAAEALECLGGNGYIEDSGMPRLYREAPLISIWEGSGNVAALDTLRAMGKEPHAIEAFFGELQLAAGADARYDDAVAMLQKQFSDLDDLQFRARRIVEQMAMLLQGSLLLRHGHPAVADAFVASRLAGDWGVAYGTLPASVDTAAILDRARIQG
jgi:putative acyl-CoA dehydrogenase